VLGSFVQMIGLMCAYISIYEQQPNQELQTPVAILCLQLLVCVALAVMVLSLHKNRVSGYSGY
jgi:hypothetical protein